MEVAVRAVKYLVLTALLTLFVLSEVFASSKILKGSVEDQNGRPVPGASVIACKGDNVIKGTATDENGCFKFNFHANYSDTLRVKATSIGYAQDLSSIIIQTDTTLVQIRLKEKPVEFGTVVVSPDNYQTAQEMSTFHYKINRASNHSLIASDPINAIRQPQVVRVGSNHSSKIRINGTSPKYYINGVNIGYDPNHYGLFSIIPAPVVSEIRFYPQGTSARYGLPSVVEILTDKPFDRRLSGDFNLSIIEGTGTIAAGGKKYFVLSSVRKSILDRIVDKIDYQTDRRSFPPTNFMDIFVSGGLKMTPANNLFVDQYHIEDFLSYQTAPSTKNPGGIKASQKTNEDYIGIRFEAIEKNVILKAGGAVKKSSERYFAQPSKTSMSSGFAVDLAAEHLNRQGNIEASILFENSKLTLGDNFEHIALRDIRLNQVNWNFLPPDYISDNPYIYQEALNSLYGSYKARDSEINNAAYLTYEHILGRFEINSGIRSEYFNRLHNSQALVYRNSLAFKIDQKNKIELFYGTFAENPVNRITEAYQVLINACLSELKPVKTRLVSLNYINGIFSIGVFSKQIADIPALIPDFNYYSPDGSFEKEFLKMLSVERINIYGGDIKLELDKFIFSKLDMFSYYGYSKADKAYNDIIRPYSLNAPHRFFIQADYRLSPKISLSAEFTARSGYSYTPSTANLDKSNLNRYSYNYFAENIQNENSMRFPANATLNLHADFKLGKFQIFLNVLNVTDHNNPIISTSDGFISDSGILPSIGINFKP